MTKSEINTLVYKYIGVADGYLRGFSYAEHERFYVEFCDLPDVDVAGARQHCGTTRATFIDILERATPPHQAKIIRGALSKLPPDSGPHQDTSSRQQLADELKRVADRLEGSLVSVLAPTSTTETVQHALADAEALLRTRGPVSAVDRLHTSLHGHLAHICRTHNIPTGPDASVTQLWSSLIAQHPKLQIPDVRKEDIRKILRSASAIVDAINTIRNRGSLGHPNQELVDEAEAWLVINVTRSLLHYLDRKLGSQ